MNAIDADCFVQDSKEEKLLNELDQLEQLPPPSNHVTCVFA
jgi:hypothetical protein